MCTGKIYRFDNDKALYIPAEKFKDQKLMLLWTVYKVFTVQLNVKVDIP